MRCISGIGVPPSSHYSANADSATTLQRFLQQMNGLQSMVAMSCRSPGLVVFAWSTQCIVGSTGGKQNIYGATVCRSTWCISRPLYFEAKNVDFGNIRCISRMEILPLFLLIIYRSTIYITIELRCLCI